MSPRQTSDKLYTNSGTLHDLLMFRRCFLHIGYIGLNTNMYYPQYITILVQTVIASGFFVRKSASYYILFHQSTDIPLLDRPPSLVAGRGSTPRPLARRGGPHGHRHPRRHLPQHPGAICRVRVASFRILLLGVHNCGQPHHHWYAPPCCPGTSSNVNPCRSDCVSDLQGRSSQEPLQRPKQLGR